MFCQNCGYKNEEGAVFCESCGARLEDKFHENAHFQNEQEINYRNSYKSDDRREIKKGIVIGVIAAFTVLLLGVIIIFGTDLLKNDGKNPDKNTVENVATDDKKDKENNFKEDDEKDKNSVDVAKNNKENENSKEDNLTDGLEKEDGEGEEIKEDKKDNEPAAILEVPVIFVGASSTLPQKDIIHYPKRTIDGDLSTAWSEGVDGSGIGESIDFGFDTFFNVSSITIWNGYHKSEKLYYANNRPKKIRVDVSNSEESFEIELRDIMKPQTIELPNPISTNHVSFTIEDVYYGNSFDDTCITEVKFFGN